MNKILIEFENLKQKYESLKRNLKEKCQNLSNLEKKDCDVTNESPHTLSKPLYNSFFKENIETDDLRYKSKSKLVKNGSTTPKKRSKNDPKHEDDLVMIHNKQIDLEKRLNLFETQRENENIKKKEKRDCTNDEMKSAAKELSDTICLVGKTNNAIMTQLLKHQIITYEIAVQIYEKFEPDEKELKLK
jgi:hypothetical protein